MARIDLNEPYNEYLKSQVEAGLFRSVTAAVEYAIHQQMIEDEKLRHASVYAAIHKGEKAVQEGRTRPYNAKLMAEISKQGKRDALAGKAVKHDIKP